jgi:hypothetical protein
MNKYSARRAYYEGKEKKQKMSRMTIKYMGKYGRTWHHSVAAKDESERASFCAHAPEGITR